MHDSTLGAFAPKMHIGSIVKFEIWVFLLQIDRLQQCFQLSFPVLWRFACHKLVTSILSVLRW